MKDSSKNPNGSGNHRKNLMQSLEGSLKRLNTDYVDVLGGNVIARDDQRARLFADIGMRPIAIPDPFRS